MPISIDSVLGDMPDALRLRARRSEILASNIANADTPGYKARDIDFRSLMTEAAAGQQLAPTATHSSHITTTGNTPDGVALKYRVPAQPSMDGNTVDMQAEHASFSENSVMYQTTLQFLGDKFKGLKSAIKGE